MSIYQKGDIVILKSGGPVMTISNVNDNYISCHWFDGKTLHCGAFSNNELKIKTVGE